MDTKLVTNKVIILLFGTLFSRSSSKGTKDLNTYFVVEYKLKIEKMRKYLLIIGILFSKTFIYSQDFIKSDTLKVKNEIYNTSHLSFGNSSLTKYFKVLTCDSSKLREIKTEIINCNRKNMLEFSEFYIISVPNYEKLPPGKEINILMCFLLKIDDERMSLKLSTALTKSKLKMYSFENEYFLDQPKNDLTEFKEYKLNIKPKEVCAFLRK